jgi:galactosamine-6-phosphate isomerase
MDVLVLPEAEALAVKAAACIVDALRARPDLLLCPATGASPTHTYQHLAAHRWRDPALFSRLRLVQLDEWGGLGATDAGSSGAYLRQHLCTPLRVGDDRYTGFQGDASDPEAECQRVTRWLQANGPLDLAVLGLGLNGHLAMNEPADVLQPHAHMAALTEETRQHPMLPAGVEPPRYGLTLGMADLLQAREVLLLVNGAHKQAILHRLLERQITTQLPASLLWLHPKATLLCDQAAFGTA